VRSLPGIPVREASGEARPGRTEPNNAPTAAAVAWRGIASQVRSPGKPDTPG
jgi:hypothetical protein